MTPENLALTSWNFFVVDTFATISPWAGGTGGAASKVAIDAAYFIGGPFVVTAVSNSTGNLGVEVWNGSLVRIASYNTTIAMADVAVAAEDDDSFGGGSVNHVVTATRTNSGNLEMQVWGFTPVLLGDCAITVRPPDFAFRRE
jgi:hypothetical protein